MYEAVIFDFPVLGRCTRRSEDKIVSGDNPSPLRAGTLLRCGESLGITRPERKTKDGFDIYGHSVAVEVIYTALLKRYPKIKLPTIKDQVWSVKQCEVLEGSTAKAARQAPEVFIDTLLAEEASLLKEEQAKQIEKIKEKLEQPKVERTAVRKTPVKRTPMTRAAAQAPVSPQPQPIRRTPVVRTPVKKA